MIATIRKGKRDGEYLLTSYSSWFIVGTHVLAVIEDTHIEFTSHTINIPTKSQKVGLNGGSKTLKRVGFKSSDEIITGEYKATIENGSLFIDF